MRLEFWHWVNGLWRGIHTHSDFEESTGGEKRKPWCGRSIRQGTRETGQRSPSGSNSRAPQQRGHGACTLLYHSTLLNYLWDKFKTLSFNRNDENHWVNTSHAMSRKLTKPRNNNILEILSFILHIGKINWLFFAKYSCTRKYVNILICAERWFLPVPLFLGQCLTCWRA